MFCLVGILYGSVSSSANQLSKQDIIKSFIEEMSQKGILKISTFLANVQVKILMKMYLSFYTKFWKFLVEPSWHECVVLYSRPHFDVKWKGEDLISGFWTNHTFTNLNCHISINTINAERGEQHDSNFLICSRIGTYTNVSYKSSFIKNCGISFLCYRQTISQDLNLHVWFFQCWNICTIVY